MLYADLLISVFWATDIRLLLPRIEIIFVSCSFIRSSSSGGFYILLAGGHYQVSCDKKSVLVSFSDLDNLDYAIVVLSS